MLSFLQFCVNSCLSEQEAKKSQFLKSVAKKDKEIAYLTDLLEQSMKQVW